MSSGQAIKARLRFPVRVAWVLGVTPVAAAVLCSAGLRPYLAGLAFPALPHATFLSPQDVPAGSHVRAFGMVI